MDGNSGTTGKGGYIGQLETTRSAVRPERSVQWRTTNDMRSPLVQKQSGGVLSGAKCGAGHTARKEREEEGEGDGRREIRCGKEGKRRRAFPFFCFWLFITFPLIRRLSLLFCSVPLSLSRHLFSPAWLPFISFLCNSCSGTASTAFSAALRWYRPEPGSEAPDSIRRHGPR
jgi:hypothetical protein